MVPLRDRGVPHVERELFESSLLSARGVLEMLGMPAHEARRAAMRFRRHNLELAERLRERRERWGFSYVIVGGADVDSFAPVVAELAGT